MNYLKWMAVPIIFLAGPSLYAQPEVYPWSNISGIRVDGELMEMNSSLCTVSSDWSDVNKTAKERGRYHFYRRGRTQHVEQEWGVCRFEQSVEDLGAGRAQLRLHTRSLADTAVAGAFFVMDLPSSGYSEGSIQFLDALTGNSLSGIPEAPDEIRRSIAGGYTIEGPSRSLAVRFNEAAGIIVRRDSSGDKQTIAIYVALIPGPMEKGESSYRTLDIQMGGTPDLRPATLRLDRTVTGRSFEGFGGNFRLQNPGVDEKVIDYCLENMQVTWGRVEMPWVFWHRQENENPLERARQGEIHPRVMAAMEMAARLHEMGMPVILSNWSAPGWAILGSRTLGPQPGGLRGNPLDPSKMEEIYQSIGDYLEYVKETFGFEFAMFSFNESDLGIYVRQTPAEHAEFIKGLGAYLRERGLKTRLLLGDTADATGWPFIREAMEDEGTHPYIGAVSFHSWRGYSDENLRKWAEAAERMDLPLIVGEGSMDAGAWRYPEIFTEPTYAMEEANLYVRILRICEPATILQWQLTADYSPLRGGGVFGNTWPELSPTQRFWNFKQIADMPSGLYAMPVDADRPRLECAALGDNDRGIYVVHLVNNGAARSVTLTGLPSGTRWARIFITNERKQMSSPRPLRFRNGETTFTADAHSFITILVDPTAS